MTTFAIIKSAGELSAKFAEQRKFGATHRALMHMNGVSALWHAAEHSNAGMLNRWYGMLTTNEQTAFRTYLDRIQSKVTILDGKETFEKTDGGKRIPTEYAFLLYANRQFKVMTKAEASEAGIADIEANKAAFKTLAENDLINPTKGKDGKGVRFFYERNNVRDSRTLYVDENKAVAQLKRLANSDGLTVSKKFKDVLTKAVSELESIADQDTGGAVPTKAETAAARKWSEDFLSNLDKNPDMTAAIAKDMDTAGSTPVKGSRASAAN